MDADRILDGSPVGLRDWHIYMFHLNWHTDYFTIGRFYGRLSKVGTIIMTGATCWLHATTFKKSQAQFVRFRFVCARHSGEDLRVGSLSSLHILFNSC